MATKKRYVVITLATVLMIWGGLLSSCTLFSSKEETDESTASETTHYAQPTQEKVIHLPTATTEEKEEEHTPKSAPTKEPTATKVEATPTEAVEASETPEPLSSEDCPIILIEGAPAAGGITASYSQTWNEAINNLQSSQAAPITLPVSDQITDLCASDGMVHVYLGWQDSNRLSDHGEMSTQDATSLLQGSSGQPAIIIP